MSFLSALMQYKFIILFYLVIILIVAFNKKRFDFQAKFIALYRTKFGINFMEKTSSRFQEFIKIVGLVGIGVAYIGMIAIVYMVFDGLYKLIMIPEAPAVLSPVIPGVPIPGSPIFVPFWYGIISLFIVVVIHEAGHGLVALAHKIKVDHTGIVFFGPLIGAFVEPNEKTLQKQSDVVQYSIFAAGPFANVILAFVLLLCFTLIFNPIIDHSVVPEGIYFQEVQEGFPAEAAGVQPETVYNLVNGQEVLDTTKFIQVLDKVSPGDEIILANENLTHTIIATESPDDPTSGYMGVIGIQTEHQLKNPKFQIIFDVLSWFYGLFQWVILLSLGIGLANLLPLGPVDGGRMLHLSLQKIFGKDKGLKIFSKITMFFIVLLLVLVFVPIIKALI